MWGNKCLARGQKHYGPLLDFVYRHMAHRLADLYSLFITRANNAVTDRAC